MTEITMPSSPFSAMPPNIQEASSASVSPPVVPTAKTIAIGAEAANRKAMTALLRWISSYSENIFLNPGKYKVSCSAVHDAHRTSAAMVFDPSLRFLNPIDNGIWNREDQLAVRNDVYKGSSIPDNMIGYIFLNFKSTWPASMRSCFETPCSSSDNVLTATLNY